MAFQLPILLISFNRPRHTRLVLEEIRKQRPAYLFVFQDGPRKSNPDDNENCAAVRNVISELIDWDCELRTYYSEKNLGCGPGPATAISWFLEHVEMGIIFEDDIVPHQDFFQYAETLLYKYQNDLAVRAIGSMKIGSKIYGNGSYYFSKMNRLLGAWATWRRAWIDFNYYMRETTPQVFKKVLKKYKFGLREREYWCERLLEIQKDALGDSSWDIQFLMSIWLNNGKGICPNVNLATNIGCDSEGTHLIAINNVSANINAESILPIKYPESMRINKHADFSYHKLYFEPYNFGLKGLRRLPYRINKRIKRLLNHQGPWFRRK